MDTNTPTRSRDRLSEAKRLLLEKRIKGQVKPAAPRNGIRRAAGGPVYPMSFAQERLWFLDQMEPGNPFYNIPAAVLLSAAALDVPTLERTWAEIVNRHEALRTVFRLVDGEPRQVVLPPHPVHIELLDLRGPGGEPAPEEAIRRTISRLSAQPFDLATGPMLRLHLIRVSNADSALVVNVHHIVTDGWSMPIITREMDELYHAYAHGLPYPLEPLEVQFPDYSVWQREYLTGETLRRQVDYWRGHLQGVPVLELPTDRPRPPVLTYRGTMYRFVWPVSLADRLRVAMVETGSSMNMVIMAGLYLMLHRYSGQDDVVVGTLLGNRNRAELEKVVGFFVNTAPVRARLRGDMTFRELVAQVRNAVLDADAHQELPLDRIVDAVTTERDPSRSPLFQVAYFHHTFVNDVHHKADSEFRSELNLREVFQESNIALVDTSTAKFDLTFATMDVDGSLSCMAEYSTDLWDERTMVRMFEHLRVLLGSAVDDLDAPLSAHSMVAGAERDRLLAWGVRELHPGAGGTLPDRLDAHAARTPDAVAVEYPGTRWTYGELDARAGRIAHRLAGMGVRPGDRVGLAAPASAGMVAALVGILRTGAAVVPLDPAYPAERLAFMLDDAGVRVLVTDGAEAAALVRDGMASIDLTRDAAALAAEDGAPFASRARSEGIAYVTFTSGSTGRPKGSLTTHAALVATVTEPEFTDIRAGDRVAQATGPAFDVAILEIWGALANGAATVGIDRDVLLDSAAYARALRDLRITHACAPMQVFNRHVREVPDVYATLRRLHIGGERVDASAVRACLAGGPPAALVQAYGPTETAIFASAFHVTEVDADAHTVPIGGPVAGTRLYVLDGRGMMCGTGVPGELCIGGERVGIGYLNRPGLTADRFVPDPFAAEPGARMYRSGDRVRWRADGTLEFVGRVDWQVKIRGFRIEPGEIEAVLREHPAVRGCVVVAREDGGERRLVAYAAAPDAPAEAELRAFLKQRLPDPMGPAAFVIMDALPLTPNGKVDRRALPAPGAAPDEAEGHDEPRTHVERVLAEVWAKVLRRERVGIHQNFFALGGDSILSIQIIGRAAEQGVRVLPKQMFTHQTVAELAEVATAAVTAEADQGAVTGELPLTPVQRWFFDQDQPEPHHWNLASLLETSQTLDPTVLEQAVAALMDHHDALRIRYARTADGWAQRIAEPGGPAPFESIDLAALPADAREAAFAEHADRVQRSLALEHGPLVRFALAQMGGGRQRLLIAAHHLVVDAVSLSFLFPDLERAYGQIARGEPVALPAKTTSFKRWAERLAEHAASPAVRAEAAYWLAQGDAEPLPAHGAGGADTDTEAETGVVTVSLDEADTRALLHEVPPVYGTQINDVLLAGLARAFAAWTGRSALAVILEGHGREQLFADADVSRTAGWFTSFHPVRLQVPEEPGAALMAVKEQLRAVPGKGIGYGLLRYLGDAETRTALAALRAPEVSFNYLGQAGGAGDGDRLLAPAREGTVGVARSPRSRRPYPLAIDAVVEDGRLYVTWTYGTRVHDAGTVERLADDYLRALRELIAHCRDPQAGGYTPSDFALAGLDQEGLDALLSQIG
ncbi:amino acid adenylation domain-containing protein [Longimicrobium sp.]|uniref:amino acid adenylation domain-containing protein n=1 Tax=Longimicrobium sp. TaxID=2029185 RepID=UPI003B3AFB6C